MQDGICPLTTKMIILAGVMVMATINIEDIIINSAKQKWNPFKEGVEKIHVE